MILDKVLLLKGLGGLTACAAVACTGTYIVRPDLFETKDQTLVDLISKVGLSDCTNVNKECTIKTEGISVKQGESNKETSKTKQTGSTGKIKVYKDNSTTDYNQGFKFVIEDGDITLTGGTGTQITKLEQFETYEIKKEDSSNDWYLTRKFTKPQAIKKGLGLPDSDTNCTLPTDNTTSTCCDLDVNKLKAINFDGKDSDGAKIATNGTVTLTITKETTDTDIFTNGYKFSFQPTQDVTISSTNKIAKNSSTEFKIKKSGSSLSLEKAWTVATLAKQVGLTDCNTGTKECTLPTTNTLKLYNGENDKTESGQVSENKKIKYEENAADHNQGFKFYAEQEITLSGNDSKKIEASTAATYEIVKNTTDSNWYLTKKAVTGGGAG